MVGLSCFNPMKALTLLTDYHEDFGKFILEAQRSIDEAGRVNRPLQPDPSENRLHFTVLPWVSFTSFAHARNLGRESQFLR